MPGKSAPGRACLRDPASLSRPPARASHALSRRARPPPGHSASAHLPTHACSALIRVCCACRLPTLDVAAHVGTKLGGTTLAGTFLACRPPCRRLRSPASNSSAPRSSAPSSSAPPSSAPPSSAPPWPAPPSLASTGCTAGRAQSRPARSTPCRARRDVGTWLTGHAAGDAIPHARWGTQRGAAHASPPAPCRCNACRVQRRARRVVRCSCWRVHAAEQWC